jgi:hypothetical protein
MSYVTEWKSGTWRERLRRMRHMHICSPRCLLNKLSAANPRTRITLRFIGPARTAIRGLAFKGSVR